MYLKLTTFQDAINLQRRPFLHCTTIPIIMLVNLLILQCRFHRFSLWLGIVMCAFFTHHIRDATRRGFWVYPFGNTAPVPYFLYIIGVIVTPFMIKLIINSKRTVSSGIDYHLVNESELVNV